jgi:glucan biosynthesis protein C
MDQARLLMIMFVISVHASMSYGHIGSWYFISDTKPDSFTTLVFIFWLGHIHTFAAAVLFLIAGYCAKKSLAQSSRSESAEKSGQSLFHQSRATFIGLRFQRLVPPTLVFMFVLHPLICLLLVQGGVDKSFAYGSYLRSGEFLGLGPLWFNEELLLFSIALALTPIGKSNPAPLKISGTRIALLALAIAIVSFFVRLKAPLGLSLYNIEVAYLPQNAMAFFVGALLARERLFESLAASPLAKRAGIAACILGPVGFVVCYLIGGPVPSHGEIPYIGGWHYQSLLLCLWEQFAGAGLTLGAISLACRKLNHPAPWAQNLGKCSFTAYVIHAPILVGVALLLRPLQAPPLVMAFVVAATGIILTFGATLGLKLLVALQAASGRMANLILAKLTPTSQ